MRNLYVYTALGMFMSDDVEHSEDCGTHALGEPCCEAYWKWLLEHYPSDAIAYLEGNLEEEE